MYEGQMISSGLGGAGNAALPQEKKSRKGLIIAIVIGVLVIGGVLAYFLIAKNDMHVSGDAKKAFNRYANYLLFGNDSADKIGNYDETILYRIDQLGEDSVKERTAFLSETSNLLSEFEKKLDNGVAKEFKDEFANYKADYELTRLAYTIPVFDLTDFLNEYAGSDNDTLRQWTQNRFSEYTSSDVGMVSDYGEDAINYYDLYAQYLNGARAIDCLNLDDMTICDNYSNATLYSQLDELRNEMVEMQGEALGNTTSGCFTLSHMMNGEKYKEDEE